MSIIPISRGRSRRLKHESWLERFGRKRRARRKILVPKGASQEGAPKGPIYTHVDDKTVHQIHAITAGIASADEQQAVAVHSRMNDAHAGEAAATGELVRLRSEESRKIESRDEYVQKVKDAGLGHKLVLQRGVKPLVALTVILAVMFETVSMSSPMALLGVLDFGGSPGTQQRVGAILAFLLALGYAGVLAVVSKRAGAELAIRHYRTHLEAEDADDDIEDRPRTTHAIFADRVIWIALGAGGAALLGASVVREAAVAIQAGSGQDQVQVAWWVFLVLTLGIFVGLTALGYWTANPIGKVYTEHQDDIDATTTAVDAKRREAYQHAARIDTCTTELAMIESRSKHEQLTQIHLGAAHIADGAANNPHIYGVLTHPDPIHDLVTNPDNHTRPLTIPARTGTLDARFEAIRAASQASSASGEAEQNDTAETAIDEPATAHDDTDEAAIDEPATAHEDTAEPTAQLLASRSAQNGSASAIAGRI